MNELYRFIHYTVFFCSIKIFYSKEYITVEWTRYLNEKEKNKLRNPSPEIFFFERHSVYAENKCTNKNATTSLKL